jgi:hypothetical protein
MVMLDPLLVFRRAQHFHIAEAPFVPNVRRKSAKRRTLPQRTGRTGSIAA